MSFQPDKITRADVIKAFEVIDNQEVKVKPSTKFDVIYNGKPYPPKEVMRLAHKHASGEHLWNLSGGQPTNKYLKSFGFKIVKKETPIMESILDVKEDFAQWLLKNAPESYSYYLGKTVQSVVVRLDEINSYFPERNIFSVSKIDNDALIQYILKKISKAERLKNKEFYAYDKKNSNGIPIAIVGKKNYLKFLKAFVAKPRKDSNLENALLPYITWYKALIVDSSEYDEIYKWEAVATFQNNWDLQTNDLVSMIDQSFPGNNNLWSSNNYYPISMLKSFAEMNPAKVVTSLTKLFDENQNLEDRILAYKIAMDELLEERNRITKQADRYHYQDGRTIGLLLAFNAPAKYFLFKYGILKSFSEKFNLEAPKKGEVANQILLNDRICGKVKDILIEDQELLKIHEERLTTKAFKKDNYNILTQDFIYSTITYAPKALKYWLYAPGENAREWEDFYEKGIMALGWDELGDLAQYNSKQEIVKALQDLFKTDSSKKNDATANYDFISEMNIGDVVFVKKGTSKLLGYGLVESDYLYDSTRNQFKHIRRMNWKMKGVWEVEHNLAIKTLTNISDYPSQDSEYNTYHERLMAIINGNEDSNSKNYAMNYPINTILYGPPGTGKTFNTVNLALEICGGKINNLDRKNIKELYDKKVMEGQIIFSTFHQSMSYEDFIEGIKPIEPEKEGDPVVYKVVEGIFKKACIEASFNFAMENDTADTDDVLDFSLAYDNFLQSLEERLASETEVELEMKNGGKVYVDSISTQGNIQIKHINGQRIYTVSKTRLSKLQKAITNLDDITNINDSFRAIIGGSNSTAYWSVLNAIQKDCHQNDPKNKVERKYTWEDKKEVVQALDRTVYKGRPSKPIVLIIDEINRGNVSAIFGELITLIEKDKRLGADEALLAQLPYSKEYFGVPPNLYIIGTMNTADRSVEALDSALRRRFSFTEMPPVPDYIREYGSSNGGEIDNVNLVELLEKINTRVEKLLDKDHAIGHSYFLKIKSLKGLKAVFANKIIPLLQEYFFGDYGKIGLVLGSGFVESVQGDNDEKFFASFEDYDLGSLLERKVYRIKNVVKMSNEEFKDALLQLLE